MSSSKLQRHERMSFHPQRNSISVLVLGDEGVGKSSLISTFVSRHFSEVVPGIMTRVRLPPDPQNSCITTIVDSQGGDAALMAAVASLSMASPSPSPSPSNHHLNTLNTGVSTSANTVSNTNMMNTALPTTNVASNNATVVASPASKASNSFYSNQINSNSANTFNDPSMMDVGSTSMSTVPSLTTLPTGTASAMRLPRVKTSTTANKTTTAPSMNLLPSIHSNTNIQSTGNPMYSNRNRSNGSSNNNNNSNNANSTTGGIENIDSIILVYDLDRDETFFRLENHWLPLIERCYNGDLPVIVAGNKMDLFLPSSTAGVSDEQVLARSRQQIVSLMQRFRFIRQCIKCSAKNLLRVDDVFLKAQQAVLYPFTPLYDLDIGQLSEDCKRALTRIFRMYDKDHDGLLSHAELDRFQNETFHVPIYERDLAGWKKVVTRNNPDEQVVKDGKFTVAGFLAIFDVFISQNRLDVPWQALRKFGYDDMLVLHVPASIRRGDDIELHTNRSTSLSSQPSSTTHWALTPSARQFLTNLFHQFDSNGDGILSTQDIQAIFSIVSDPALPIWHPLRAHDEFEECFSLPMMPVGPGSSSSQSTGSAEAETDADAESSSPFNLSTSLSASGITIVSGDSFPSVDISAVSGSYTNVHSRPLSYLQWMGLWHAVSAISPSQTRAELFRLGHMEDPKVNKKFSNPRARGRGRRSKNTTVVPLSLSSSPDASIPSREVRALILGSPGSGKTAFLNSLGFNLREPLVTTKTKAPRTYSIYTKIKESKNKVKSDLQSDLFVVHLLLTEIPEASAENQAQQRKEVSGILNDDGCDLVILTFDTTNSASLAYAKHLETSLLHDDIPRVYIGTKSDQCAVTEDKEIEDDEWQPTTVVDEAGIHCRELDIEPPFVTSATATMLSAGGELGVINRQKTMEHLARCVLSDFGLRRLRSKPHEEEKRQEATKRRNRKMIWFGVGMGVAVAVVGYLTAGVTGGNGSNGANKSSSSNGSRKSRLSWFRNYFFSLGGSLTKDEVQSNSPSPPPQFSISTTSSRLE